MVLKRRFQKIDKNPENLNFRLYLKYPIGEQKQEYSAAKSEKLPGQ